MQRQIVHGVPYFTDAANRLFTWDTEAAPQHIGTYHPDTGTVSFTDGHLTKLSGRLQSWRAKQHPRPRKPGATTAAAASNSRGNTRDKADGEEDSDADE